MDKLPIGTVVAMKDERTFGRDSTTPLEVSRGQRLEVVGYDAMRSRNVGKFGEHEVLFMRNWVAVVGPCEKCNLLFELYEQTEKCNRDYWLMTELFTWLHDGDACPLAKGEHPVQIVAPDPEKKRGIKGTLCVNTPGDAGGPCPGGICSECIVVPSYVKQESHE